MSEVTEMNVEAEDNVDSEIQLLPNEEQLELAERIIARLNPPHRAAISKMIHTKAKYVGSIVAGWMVFWWLTVQQADGNSFSSIFFGPDFLLISILAPMLVFLGSLLSDFSREMGKLFPGLVSGIMFVFAVLYVCEPAVMGMVGDMDVTTALWMTVRLLILCSTTLFAAKLLIDAWLLGWVKALMDSYPELDFSDNEIIPEEVEHVETEA